MTKKRGLVKTIIGAAIGLLCAATFLLGLFVPNLSENKRTDAAVSSTVIGNIYKNGAFVKENLDALAVKAGYSDLASMTSAAKNSATAVKTAADFGGASVKFGEYTYNGTTYELTWLPVYLSRDDDGNAILTLWLADVDGSNTKSLQEWSPFNDGTLYPSGVTWGSKTYTEGTYRGEVCNSAYDGAYIRHAMINADNNCLTNWGQRASVQSSTDVTKFTKFTMFTSGALSEYIVSPNKVGWQMAESTYPNDPAYSGNRKEYVPSNWTKDKIWLPSQGELADNALWKLTSAQRAVSAITGNVATGSMASGGTWTRSGQETLNLGYVEYFFDQNGNSASYTHSDARKAVRPAFHFNLSALGITVPKDVTKEYTGKTLDCTDQSWFDSATHGDPTVMSISAPTLRNSGEYTVRFNIISTDPEVVFADGTRSASIKFTITQKPISLIPDTSGGGITFTVPESQVCEGDDPPDIGISYYTESGEPMGAPPNSRGTYIAEAYIIDAESSNYKLAMEYRQSFEITAIPVSVPTVAGNVSQSYTGSEVAFSLANFDATLVNEPTVKTAGMEMRMVDGVRTFFATEAKRYEIQFTLKNVTDYCWDTGGTGTKSLYLTITQRPLTLTFARENNNWQWDTGTNGQFTVTHDGVDGDNIALNISYIKPDGTKILADRTSVSGKVTTVTLSALDRGDYEIVAELAPAQANVNKNANYTLRQEYRHSFTVVGRPASMPELKWQISVGGVVNPLTSGQSFTYTGGEFTVSLDTSDFPANGVDIKRNSWENNRNTVVGSYLTSVTITAYDDGWEFIEQTVQISWSITKALYDLSNTKWNYNDNSPLVYNGSTQNVALINVPMGLTALYSRDYQDASGDGSYYSTSILSLSNGDTANYTTPVKGDPTTYKEDANDPFTWEIQWRIVKKPIELNWTMASTKDANGRTFQYPTLPVDANRVTFIFRTEQGNVTSLNNIVVRQGFQDLYSVEATLSLENSRNYQLSGATTTFEFTVGRVGTAVEILGITNSGNEYNAQPQAATFTFTDGTSLTAEDFALSYFLDGTPLDGAPTNAGRYTVRFSLVAGTATQAYYIEGDDTFDFEIIKATLDTSSVRWNYSEPFPYAIEDGSAKTYEVKLINLPAYLEGLVSYGGVQRNSSVSINTATASFADFDSDNYNAWSLPAGVENSLVWRIVPRELTKPTYTGGKITFDNLERDLYDLVRFPEDRDTYVTVTVTKSGDASYDGSHLVKDAGRYVVTCSIKGEYLINEDVVWAGGDTIGQYAVVEIVPAELVITGWANKPPRPVFENGFVDRAFYNVVYTYTNDANVLTEVAEIELSNPQYYGKTITATVTVPAAMENNVTLRLQGVSDSADFVMFEPGGERVLDRPTLEQATIEYDGEEHEFVLLGVQVAYMNVSGSLVRTEVGESTVTITLDPKQDVKWNVGDSGDDERGAVILKFSIVKGRISAEEDDWNDNATPPVLRLSGDQANAVEYVYQNASGTPVELSKLKPDTKYYVIAKIKAEYQDKYGFISGSGLSDSSAPFEFTYILKAEIPTLKVPSFVYDGNTHDITADSFDNFNDRYVEIKGTVSFRNAGTYEITLGIKEGSGAVWASGGTDDRTVTLIITKAEVSIIWDLVSYRTPSAKIEGFPNNAFVYEYADVATGSTVASTALKNGSSYNARIRLTGTYATNYMFAETQDEVSETQFFELSANKPVDPANPVVPSGNTDTDIGGGGGGLPANLPLWQLIVGGISVVLILVFGTKITQVRGRTKRAKQAATAKSFGGFALLAAGPWLGLPQIAWTAIALALLGVAALLFILYLVLNKKCLAAEAAAAEAEKRRQAELEEEKEEERRRRDEEFKIMMANMMGNVQPAQPFSGGDIKELVGEVVSSIMPAMQALPAPSAEMQQMLEQQQQMIEALMNNQQQLQALPAPDNDKIAELEERLAEQQRLADERLAQQQAMMLEQQRMAEERAAEQQRLTEERIQAERADAQRREEEARKIQQEMMARQEELIKKMLEREAAPVVVQSEGGGGSNTTNSFVYEVEEEKLSIDRLTLAEAYEAMNDNLKKLFDELVAYVTSKPETAESDGKYAISFKYRAKALFKLVIKRGIPTINYSTEGEQLRQIKRDAAASEGLKVRFKLSELQVMDSSTFDVAKEVINACMQQIDKDIEYIKAQKAAKKAANKK